MKKKLILAVLAMLAFFPIANAQQKYQNEPLIDANNESAAVLVGRIWTEKRWRISPQIARDTLTIKLYGKEEQVGFRTDLDSIKFKIGAGKTKSFYIKLGNQPPAHTYVFGKIFTPEMLTFKTAKRADVAILYQNEKNQYFDSLRRLYPIGTLKDDKTDQQRVLTILNWTHHQWKHNGGNTPKGSDGISILNEAKAGGQFPCFAYSIVLRDQLIAHGYKARVLYIKTKDAATKKGSPGHAVTEVFLNDQKKWAFVDGQFNAMPSLNGKPLNAVEFQQAISKNYDQLKIWSKDENFDKRSYIDFVYEYLYYLDTSLDQRLLPAKELNRIEDKRSIMLVPVAAPPLTKIDFWNMQVDYCLYTNSIGDFYAVPK